MNENLKGFLEQLVKELREQGHDPLERPVVFIWSYPEEELKFTLVIQKKEDEEEQDKPVSH
jgi:hypothetical protein